MKNASICFSEAQQAWSLWNQVPYANRHQSLLAASDALAIESFTLPLTFHHKHCHQLLTEPELMPGPTGETNELYTAGRGVAMIVADRLVDIHAAKALYAQLVVGLLSGNCVIMCVQDSELAKQVLTVIDALKLPSGVLSLVEYDQYAQLLESDIRIVSIIADASLVKEINRNLAKKSGAIAPLIAEVELAKMPVSQDPMLVLRYITERTRTINITAVGGNATLLELGSAEH
ncbi:hypothetical protein A9264_09695 [Vibrio sp. UCD-FRSSP16_10]|uniref:hypothetical protein n=1 Tax=unclassified Vibrio TaxID=2614977 RepID=UPI0007FFC1D9|nr:MULTISPECIES: hypothetical protein [unclassified Vibrio]OBT16991.1 hypothetical protein A9260_09920 [Vibrio sp. UCD-FRSSP16_30]OBT21982.1 hypothetical protein A9264_09695 [Vibrio sp. UCD-FRSSP16_10]